MPETDEENNMPKTWLLLRRIYLKKMEEECGKAV